MSSLIGARIVPDAKITRYLLDPDHPIGGNKARFFNQFGFLRDDSAVFVAALLRHAHERPVHSERLHNRGINRALRCTIRTPDGRNPCVVVVWFQAHGDSAQRLVTAYPAPN